MAQRYGGKFSPDGRGTSTGTSTGAPAAPPRRGPLHGRKPARGQARVNMLFVVPLAFAVTAFHQAPVGLALDLGTCGILLLAAWLTREGLRAQEAYEARKIARRPAIPRKIFGSVLTGLGLALGGYAPGGPLLAPVLFAGLGGALHLFAFGPDPLRNKGMADADAFQTDRVARAVGEAEKHLAALHEAILRTGDRQLVDRVDAFAATARTMFRTIENDPRDLTASRKYLGIYLIGARDATAKFADIYANGHGAGARADYLALLDDLEGNFSAQTNALLKNDRTDLDIQIDVLRDRLRREGVQTG